MVVKRACSFCAGEIEPGTGTMYVKRDGTVYHFCTSSCRKQQLHLGRVGHRLKWTRAHAIRKATEQSTSAKAEAAAKARSTPAPAPTAPAPAAAPAEPAASEAAPAAAPAEKKAAKTPRKTGTRRRAGSA